MKKPLIPTLSTLLLPAALFGLAAASCGGTECTNIGCLSAVQVTMLNAAGDPLQSFTATVTVAGQDRLVECSGASGSGTAYTCSSDGFSLFGVAESQPDLQIEASEAGGASFSGSVSPTFTVDDAFNGAGCGTCTSGEVTVDLQ